MDTYIGTKIIEAQPSVQLSDPAKSGYAVRYPDGYESWSPADVFEEAYQTLDKMNFGHALEMLKRGEAVARSGWNGKGMFLYLVGPGNYPAQTGVAKAHWGETALVPYGPYIAMKTAQHNVVPWLASQTDVLADDWMVVGVGAQRQATEGGTRG